MGEPLVSLSAGAASTCGVTTAGAVKCWGRNHRGQLGNGSVTASTLPVLVQGITTAVQVSVGFEHACALLANASVRCWGRNAHGQLGNDSTIDSSTPVQVTGLTGVSSIHAGVFSTCALATNGGVACWGRGGDLGDGSLTPSRLPRVVPNLANVRQLSVSTAYLSANPIHVCGVRADGTAFCWGDNSDGQLGTGTQLDSSIPVTVPGISDALEIGAGPVHTCVRRTSGVSCWGAGQQVGDGANTRRLSPVSVALPHPAAALVVGEDHTLLATTMSGLSCWGRGNSGQCGTAAAFTPGGPIHLTPVTSVVMNATLIAAGGGHSCAFVSATRLTWCWGSNEWGELGYETVDLRTSTPALVRW